MKSFTLYIGCFVWMFFISAASFAQSAEKIHVHFDKDIYLPGETVWFKAYIFEFGKPSVSTNLYAGWYNKEGKLLQEKRLAVFTGTANGDFAIPDSAPSPVYQLRLFTRNMRQADSSQVFLRSVAVYQPGKKTTAPVTYDPVSVNVYPEGGSLIAGINNHVAFRMIPVGQATTNVGAALTDAEGKLVDSVYFDNTGLAKIQFTPRAATKYLLQWPGMNGEPQSVSLPAAEMNGATLHTELAGSDLYYMVQKNNSIPRFNKLNLYVSSGKDTIYSVQLNLEKNPQLINKLPADSFPPGLVDISLADDDGNMLQRKSVFTKNRGADPEISIIEKSSAPKGKNVIEIKIKDTSLNLLSLSVIDELFYPMAKTSMVDDLLLNNETANLYNAAGDAKQSDLVVMTSGLKYISPNSVSENTDNYLSLLAYLDRSKTLPDKATLTLIANDKVNGKQVFSLQPGKDKNFASTGLIVYDSTKLYYQLSNKEYSNYMSLAEISNLKQPPFIKEAKDIGVTELKKYAALSEVSFDNYAKINSEEKFNDVKTLKEVAVKGKKKNSYMARMQELDDRYASNMFRGLGRGEQFNVIDDPMADGYFDVFSYLAGKVPGISINRSSIGGTITSNRGVGGGEPVTVFIDETLASFDMLATIPLSQVAYIKVINGIVIGVGGAVTTGAIYIYTRKGNDIKITTPPMPHVVIKGYDFPKEFLNPDYSSKQNATSKDYRSTLYWNPYIETDKNSQTIRVEFYNNDVSKKPVLVLKGFNEAGEIIEIRKVLE